MLLKQLREPIAAVKQSTWTDIRELKKHGWTTKISKNIDYGDMGGSSYMHTSLEQIFKAYGFSKKAEHNLETKIVNDEDAKPADHVHPKSMADFSNILNPQVIIALYNYAPGNTPPDVPNPDIPKEYLTPLKRWWDAIFLLWQDFVSNDGASMKQLRCIIRNNISGMETIKIIDQAMKMKDPTYYAGSTKEFDEGTWFHMDKDEGAAAILGTPNGQGVAKFLFEHKAQLGMKTISRVKVYKPDDFEDHALLFELEDLELEQAA
jgi:hypothetical protein